METATAPTTDLPRDQPMVIATAPTTEVVHLTVLPRGHSMETATAPTTVTATDPKMVPLRDYLKDPAPMKY